MTRRIHNIPLLVFILTVALASMSVLYYRVRQNMPGSQNGTQDQRRATLSLQPNDYVLGDPNATVVLFEYADTECPFCKRLYFKLEGIVSEYIQKGIPLAVVYRHAPLGIWDKSITEAHAAECVGAQQSAQGYYAFLGKLYTATPSYNGLDMDILPKLATSAGADGAIFVACMDSLEYRDKIKEQKLSSAALGVSTIPHVFIVSKDQIYEVVGNKPKSTITFLIEQALSRPFAE